jgi:hypothetical protein
LGRPAFSAIVARYTLRSRCSGSMASASLCLSIALSLSLVTERSSHPGSVRTPAAPRGDAAVLDKARCDAARAAAASGPTTRCARRGLHVARGQARPGDVARQIATRLSSAPMTSSSSKSAERPMTSDVTRGPAAAADATRRGASDTYGTISASILFTALVCPRERADF